MNPITADQQITLQAFQAAVNTYQQRGLALPDEIHAIVPNLEQHLDQLDALSEIDPTFEMVYQAARSALQTTTERAKFLATSAIDTSSANTTDQSKNHEQTRDNGNGAIENPISPHTIAPPSSMSMPMGGTIYGNTITAPSPKPRTNSSGTTRSTASVWENFDRIAIMGAGGAFLGAAIVQLFGGGATQFVGAIVGAIVGGYSGYYVNFSSQTRRKS